MQAENLTIDPGFITSDLDVIDLREGAKNLGRDIGAGAARFYEKNKGYLRGAAVIGFTTVMVSNALPVEAQRLEDEGAAALTLIDQVGQGVRYVLESPLIVPAVGLVEGIADVVLTPRQVAEDAPAPTIPELAKEIVIRGLAEAGEMTVALVALDNVIKGNLPPLAQTATVGTLLMTLPYTLLPDVLAKPITNGIKTVLHGVVDIAMEIGKRQEKKSD